VTNDLWLPLAIDTMHGDAFFQLKGFKIMMLVGLIGGLIACGAILAGFRSVMRSKKATHVLSVGLR
jgi:hypothetical protein